MRLHRDQRNLLEAALHWLEEKTVLLEVRRVGVAVEEVRLGGRVGEVVFVKEGL